MDDELDKALAKIRAQQASSPQHDDMDAALAKIRAGQPAPTPEGPGVISRGLTRAAEGIGNMIRHPIDTAESIVTGPIKSALTSARFAAEQDAENAVAMNTGRTGVGERTITPKQAAGADLQTFANIAAPAVFRGAKAATAMIPKIGGKIATGAGLAASGATTGAASNLDDPLAGAIAGGTTALALGGAVNAATKPNLVTTAIKAKRAPEVQQHLVDLETARTKAADPLYADFRSLGDLGRSPKLDALIGTQNSDGLPIVRRAINAVKGESPKLQALPDTHAEVLAAVHEKVGDQAFRAMHGYTKDDARIALHDAIDELAQQKGGSFAAPTTAFREGSQKMDAVQRGRDVLANALTPQGGSESAVLDKSPPAFKKWFGQAATSDAERQKALQGLAGQIGRQGIAKAGRVAGVPVVPFPSSALKAGNKILKSVTAPQSTEQILQLMGIPAATITNNP